MFKIGDKVQSVSLSYVKGEVVGLIPAPSNLGLYVVHILEGIEQLNQELFLAEYPVLPYQEGSLKTWRPTRVFGGIRFEAGDVRFIHPGEWYLDQNDYPRYQSWDSDTMEKYCVLTPVGSIEQVG